MEVMNDVRLSRIPFPIAEVKTSLRTLCKVCRYRATTVLATWGIGSHGLAPLWKTDSSPLFQRLNFSKQAVIATIYGKRLHWFQGQDYAALLQPFA
jgi:hypothetical protein